MAGDQRALEGLTVVDVAREAHVDIPTSLHGTLENYRVWLFGRGEQREGVIDEKGTIGPVGRVGIDPARVAEVSKRHSQPLW